VKEAEILKHKTLLRQRFRLLRDRFEGRDLASRKICAGVAALPEFVNARSVMLYAATGSEVATAELIDLAFHEQKKVFLPFVNKVTVGQLKSRSELVPGAKGILEPAKGLSPAALRSFKPDLIVIPGIAFDLEHQRLGSGSGWYDRFLKMLAGKVPTIGLAFEVQIAKELPHGSFDVAVEMVATEMRLF
jgi:5-formyltetrahydrofolate cyclo-ligase